MKTKKLISCICIGSFFVICNLISARPVKSQGAISLSITPPLTEILIKPGSEVIQIYTLSNSGGATTISPEIVYFEPNGENGNLTLTEQKAPLWIKYKQEEFLLGQGKSVDFRVLIAPSLDTLEEDHYLTVVFESKEAQDLLGQDASFHKSQIGSNLLVTVSTNGRPEKRANIVSFTAPKVVDSFFPIDYALTLANTGNSFWKPIGKIAVADQILNLAPQNILSGHRRNISCINDSNLSSCKVTKHAPIGVISAKLEFSLDDDSLIYTQEVKTVVFPFYLTASILLSIPLTLFLRKVILSKKQIKP